MYIQVVPKGYKSGYHWSPNDGCSFGNCGAGSEESFIAWVNGNFAHQDHQQLDLERERTSDLAPLKVAIDKARAAGYVVSVHCGCGEGWQDPRCGEDIGSCIVTKARAL